MKLSVLLQGYYMLEFFLLTVCNVLAGRFWQVLGIKIWLTTSWTNRIYFDMEWKWKQSMGCSKAEDNMGGEGLFKCIKQNCWRIIMYFSLWVRMGQGQEMFGIVVFCSVSGKAGIWTWISKQPVGYYSIIFSFLKFWTVSFVFQKRKKNLTSCYIICLFFFFQWYIQQYSKDHCVK